MPKKEQHTLPKIKLAPFLNRYHGVIYAATVCLGLAAAVYLLADIVANPSTPTGYTPDATNTSFDTATIERVDQLRPLSSPPEKIQLPSGRNNPFLR